jgi:hypothetical protein
MTSLFSKETGLKVFTNKCVNPLPVTREDFIANAAPSMDAGKATTVSRRSSSSNTVATVAITSLDIRVPE